ncbi:MAG: SIR2 family protein [Devosia sp.]
MPIEAADLQRVIDSIEANNLVLLCGAGLSIPPPSRLMSALAVSRHVYDAYLPAQVLPPVLRDDIDQLAGHFLAQGQFDSLFINRLVPWDELTGEPNDGHVAVADFLLSGAARFAMSANFDTMIEQWSSQRKVQLRGALTGVEATALADYTSPLLKFHGCMGLDRPHTLWTQGQLALASIQPRINSCKAWMEMNLPGRDLLVVGFWTDWGYFNDVLEGILDGGATSSITVIDPEETATLQGKAPALWGILSASPHFKHVKDSGNVVLPVIRDTYSKVWVRKLYALGAPLYHDVTGNHPPAGGFDAPALDGASLYEIRRDAEGVATNRAARQRAPGASAAQTGLAHLLMTASADARSGAWYLKGGQAIRVVHGAGEGLTTVESRFTENPTAPKADIVICAGSLEQGVPGLIVGKGTAAGIVRPKAGAGSRWITLETARSEHLL